jgi:hypothetical protein
MPDKMDRTQQPPISELEELDLQKPVRTVLPNGIPLSAINSGEQEVCRMTWCLKRDNFVRTPASGDFYLPHVARRHDPLHIGPKLLRSSILWGMALELTCSMEHAINALHARTLLPRNPVGAALHGDRTGISGEGIATVVDMNCIGCK